MKYTFWIIYLCVLAAGAQAEIKQMDSLQDLMAFARNDSIWVAKADMLAGLKGYYSPNASEKLFFKALKKLQSDNYIFSDKYDRIASIYDGLGIIERRRNNFDKALDYYFKGLKIKERQKDSLNIGRSYHNIAMLHYNRRDYDLAISYMRKALPIRKKVDSVSYAKSLNNYGNFHFKQKSLDSALFYFNKAKLFFGNDIRVNDANLYIARLFDYQKNYNRALETNLHILEIYKKHGKQERVAMVLKGIAHNYRKLNNLTKAEIKLNESESIAKLFGSKKMIGELYKERYYIAKARNDYEAALNYYQIYRKYQDSVFTMEQSEKIESLQFNYQFEKEVLADSLNYKAKEERLVMLVASQKNKKQLYVVLLVVTLLTLISLFFLYRFRHKNNIQAILKQELEADLLNEKIDFLRFRIEQLLADNKMRVDFKKELKQKIILLKEDVNKDLLISEYQSILVEIENQIQTENRLDGLSINTQNQDEFFEIKLADKFPNLSKSEREVCSLIRLNLSVKEIMNVLNITMSSVKSTRYRIRKKLEVPKDVPLELFIRRLFK